MTRLRELERARKGAQARLQRAQHRTHHTTTTDPPQRPAPSEGVFRSFPQVVADAVGIVG